MIILAETLLENTTQHAHQMSGNMYVFLYFLIAAVLLAGFFGLNRAFKWLTKNDWENEIHVPLVFFGALFWPIALPLIAVFGIFHLIEIYILPD